MDFGTAMFIQLSGNIQSEISYNYTVNEEFEGFDAKDMSEYSSFVSCSPSEAVRLGVITEFGESIR